MSEKKEVKDWFSHFSSKKMAEEHLAERVESLKETLSIVRTKSLSPALSIRGLEQKSSDVVGLSVLVNASSDDPEEKREVFMKLGTEIAKKEILPMSIVLVSEAWILVVDKDQKIEGRISNDPKSQEVIMLSCSSVKGYGKVALFNLSRDENECIIMGEQMDTNEMKGVGNFLLDAFYQGVYDETQKDEAKES